jgi:signal transduction histidine kinase
VARLIVIKGPDEGRQFELPADAPVPIGRDRSNRIVLHDTEVSRKHAEIAPTKDGAYKLRDVGSANGTLVNTQPVREIPLQAGDHITLGQTILVFSSARTERPQANSEIASQIRLITRKEDEVPSAIVKTVAEDEGSRILARPGEAGTQWLKARLASLSVMYETTQAVSHILDLDQLLDRILELIFNSIPADHGCVMLRNPDGGEFEPKAVRFRDGVNRNEKMTVSRTIMEWVLEQRQGVLISDAARDARFASGNSITRFNIQEVVCVPMKGRHETHGVLFLDTVTNTKRLVAEGKEVPARLTEEHLSLAIAIAHQAALAVEETRYHQAMVQGERLAAIGQTIAALSHHIKNIMQGIVFGSDMVRSAMTDKDEEMLQKGWRLVDKNQGKIHDLVMDMLSFSKERDPVIESTDLNRVVEDVVEVVRGRAEDRAVRLDVRLSPSLPPVPADPDGVHKALLNIVSNALDAVEDRDEPYVGVQTLLEPNGEWARIVVLDHGPGIPPDKVGEIFKPFVSTKGAKGTGLGLPVSRKIFREHGGDVLVESKVGRGSKFILRLPMKSPLAPDPNGSPDPGTILKPTEPAADA